MALLDGNLRVTGTVQAGDILGQREIKTITGDGETVNFFLSHTLGIRDVQVSVYNAGRELCLVKVILKSVGNLCVSFVDPPESEEEFTVVIQK